MVRTERLEYQALGIEMIGFLAVDDTAGDGDRSAVLLMHEGVGQDDNVRVRAERLAALGYVAFALDYLGGGRLHPVPEAQARLGDLFDDPAATGQLALAATRCSSTNQASTRTGLPPSGSASVV